VFLSKWSGWRHLAAGIAIVLLLGEILLRIVAATVPGARQLLAPRSCYTAGEYRDISSLKDLVAASPLSLPPHGNLFGFTLNSSGLRTGKYAAERRPGTFRFVVIGDSYFFEAGSVPDSMHVVTRLGARLAHRMASEVINLAVPGANPEFYLRMLELEGCRLNPDVVLVELSIGSDLAYLETAEPFFPSEGLHMSRFWTLRLVNGIYRYATGAGDKRFSWGKPGKSRAGGIGGRATDYPGEWPPKPPMTRADWWRMHEEGARMFRSSWEGGMKQAWSLTADTYGAIAETANRAGIPLLVVLIPGEVQVSPSLQAILRREFPAEALDFDVPNKIINEFCRAENIQVLDLLPVFRKASARGDILFMPRDANWNPLGQAIAAGAIAERLEKMAPHPRRTGNN